jgi:hypothetical protein
MVSNSMINDRLSMAFFRNCCRARRRRLFSSDIQCWMTTDRASLALIFDWGNKKKIFLLFLSELFRSIDFKTLNHVVFNLFEDLARMKEVLKFPFLVPDQDAPPG